MGLPKNPNSSSLLKERIEQLENAIREHRDQKADDRCIFDDDKLYEVLGDGIKCGRRVGCKFDMLKNCARFIDKRTEEGEWPTYKELEEKITKLNNLIRQILSQFICEGQHDIYQFFDEKFQSI